MKPEELAVLRERLATADQLQQQIRELKRQRELFTSGWQIRQIILELPESGGCEINLKMADGEMYRLSQFHDFVRTTRHAIYEMIGERLKLAQDKLEAL